MQGELDSGLEPVGEEPFSLWQAVYQGGSSGVIADLPCRDKEADRATAGVCNSMKLCIHAALGPANQASTPPFLTPKLVAVRCAFK